MNNKILNEWTKIIGHERVKIVIDLFFNRKINLDFPNLGQGDLTYVKKNIISELEDTGTILLELDGNILNHEEIIRMVDILAKDLISMSIPDIFIESISNTLLNEDLIDKELDDEIKYIKGILNSIHRHKEEIE